MIIKLIPYSDLGMHPAPGDELGYYARGRGLDARGDEGRPGGFLQMIQPHGGGGVRPKVHLRGIPSDLSGDGAGAQGPEDLNGSKDTSTLIIIKKEKDAMGRAQDGLKNGQSRLHEANDEPICN
jgi:hypothetical protein